jgi:hypothetical protein
MLISLSLVSRHPHIRPELLVFDALCTLDNVLIPKWTSSGVMQARRRAEMQVYGALHTPSHTCHYMRATGTQAIVPAACWTWGMEAGGAGSEREELQYRQG